MKRRKKFQKNIYKQLFIIYNYLGKGRLYMKLSFKYNVKDIKTKQKEIISDLIWHTKKVSNTLLYDIREGKKN